MATFLDILVPCGFGPPGSLPQPLPGGVDGGSSDIPTDPPGGGPGIIINPVDPLEPGIPTQKDPPINPDPPIIVINEVLNVDETEGTILCGTDIPTEASGTCTGPTGFPIIEVFTPNVYLTDHVLTFAGLEPGTLYTYSILCRESSVQHLSVLATGTFNTLEIIDPPGGNGNAGEFEGIDPSISTHNNIYDPYIQRTLYEDLQVDLKYTPYTIVPTGFKATYGTAGTNILSTTRHKSVDNILINKVASLEEANLDKENSTLTDIKGSLRKDISKSLENISYPNGIPVNQVNLLTGIKRHVLEGSIDLVDRDYILSFPPKPADPIKPRVIVKKSEYGSKIESLTSSRIIKPVSTVTSSFTRSLTEGLSIIRNKAQSLNPESYLDDSSELLRLWYFIPEDINKRVEYLDSNGEVGSYFINNDESVYYTTSSGASALAYVTIHDTLDFISGGGIESDYYVESDIEKAVTLNNSDDLLAKYHLGIVDDILIQVSSLRDLELSATASSLPTTHYILTLEPSTVRDSGKSTSPFIAESLANYIVKDQSAGDVSDINDILKFSAYPWKVLFVDFNDPILDYLEYTDTVVQAAFKDVSLNSVGARLSNSQQLYVRKIPKTIVIIPTDRTKMNLFNGRSALIDWGVRQIRFEKSPDTQLLSPGLTYSPFKIENTYLNSSGESKSGFFSTQAYHCVYDEEHNNYESSFKDSANKPARTEPGIRKALSVILSLSANYELNEGLTFYDVYSRLNRKELYNLDYTVPKSIINRLAIGEQTGVNLYNIPSVKNSTITNRASSTRLIGLKVGATEEYVSEYVEPTLIETQIEIIQNPGGFLSV